MARTLLAADKVRHAAFFVHLAIEKALKARVVSASQDLPPRSHDLLLLAERAGVTLSQDQRDFLARIQVYCMEGRYPTQLPMPPDPKAVQHDLQVAEELIKWLSSPSSNP